MSAYKALKITGSVILSFSIVCFALLCLNFFNADRAIAQLFFDTSSGTWLIDKNNLWFKGIFYTFPKLLLVLFLSICGALVLLLRLICIIITKRSIFAFLGNQYNRNMMYIIFCISLSAVTVSILKHLTCVQCPYDLMEYGGNNKMQCRDIIKSFIYFLSSSQDMQQKCGQCFPSSHAVVGFGLISLASTTKNSYRRSMYKIFSIVLGILCSLYQMMTGAHFFSHCIVSFIICYAIALMFSILLDVLSQRILVYNATA